MSAIKMIYPPLFKIDSKGAKREWNVSATLQDGEHGVLVSHGISGSDKIQTTFKPSAAKNIGRANETGAKEQSRKEAESLWRKTLDKGYAMAGETTEKFLPMLAHDFNKRGKDIVYPCFTQPKLDGIRCIYSNGKLTSRNAKVFSFPGSKEIIESIEKSSLSGMVLDGELFNPDLAFETIVSITKNSKDMGVGKVSLWVFDVVSKEGYKDRRLKLEGLPKINGVKIVESLVANSIDDVKKAHAKYTKQGFEGTMIRNKLGAYKSGRSANLQKFKDFMDDEFKIVDFTEGEGHDKGCVVWECETKDKQTFKVRPRGDVSQRKAWFKEGAKNNGKKLNVRFQEYSTAGVPRFPVGTGIRDYE